jgi:LacI family transcriptional regulator
LNTVTDDPAISAAVRYITEHACEGLGVERLVKETQRVPKSVFVRRFRAATGQTPRAAILRRQLEEARRLLAGTELSLAFIAEHCGFRNLDVLERALHTAEGQTATAFRQRSRPAQDGQSTSPLPPPLTGTVRPAGGRLSQNS